MHLIMFDIDGTLVNSYDVDSDCFIKAVQDVLDIKIDSDWEKYQDVTDSGILDEILLRHQKSGSRKFIHRQVQECFLRHLSQHISENKIEEVFGASEFIIELNKREDVVISIATGSWREAGLLKLKAAGIDCRGIYMASSSDYPQRLETMKLAERMSGDNSYESRSYFGDGLWDRTASRELGFDFVLVGDRFKHYRQINDFSDTSKILSLIGIEN